MKPYYLAVLTLLIQTVPGLCQGTVTNTAKQTENAATGQVKGWFKRRHTPKLGETKREALKIPTGSPVKVMSTDGTKVKGALTEVTNDGIRVKTGKGPAQSFAYDRISSLKKMRGPKMSLDGTPNRGKLHASLGNIPQGAPVNLKLTDKTKISGRYLGKTADGIRVQTPQGDKMAERTIPSDEIAGVRPEKPGLFSKPKFQPPDLVKKTVSGVPVGSPMNIKTPDGKDVSGKLTGATDNGFTMQTLEGGNIVNKDLPYDQVASVKLPNSGIKQLIPGLHPPALQSGPQIKAAAMDIPAGSLVTLQMPDGSKSTGKLMGVTNDGMQVQSLKAGELVTQNVSFDQIGSVQQGLPVTPADRAKRYGRSAAMVVVTGLVSGALAGVIARVR